MSKIICIGCPAEITEQQKRKNAGMCADCLKKAARTAIKLLRK